MTLIRNIAIWVIMLFASPLHATENALDASDISTYLHMLEQPDNVRAEFSEVKTVPSLSRKLTSSGVFTYKKHDSVMWKRVTPFATTTRITKDGIEHWVEGEKLPYSDKMQQTMRPVLEMVFSIFSGDFTAVLKHFTVYKCASKSSAWCLRLAPTASHMRPYLQEIRVNGERFIEHVTIVNAPNKLSEQTYSQHMVDEPTQ